MKNTKVKNFILIIAQPMLNGSKATLTRFNIACVILCSGTEAKVI